MRPLFGPLHLLLLAESSPHHFVHCRLHTSRRDRLAVAIPFPVIRDQVSIIDWEDKFQRLLLRFERIQQRHYGMKVRAYTLINLRKFCGTKPSQEQPLPVIPDGVGLAIAW